MSFQRFKDGILMGLSPHCAAHSELIEKKDSKPPDYTPVAQASEEAARIMADLGREQLAEARRQYDLAAPFVRDIAEQQLQSAQETQQQGRDYYNYLKDTFRPQEQKLVSQVDQYNTEAERQRQAEAAATDVERQAAIQKQISARDLARMGINPNSQRALAVQNGRGLQVAGMRAGAMTNARRRAADIGYARRLDVVGIGRNLPGASVSAYGAATNAGNSAAGNFQAPGQNLLTGMAAGVNTIGKGQQMNLQGRTAILNAQTSYANARANKGDLLDVVGTGLGAWAGAGFPT